MDEAARRPAPGSDEDAAAAGTHGAARAGPDRTKSEPDHKLTLSLPVSVVRQLRARMAAEETTIRALVLEALRGSGYAVPTDEIRDRRRGVGTATGQDVPADLGRPAARRGDKPADPAAATPAPGWPARKAALSLGLPRARGRRP